MDEQGTATAQGVQGGTPDWHVERHAISREIHDEIAHSLLAMQTKLERLEAHQSSWEPGARRLFADAKHAAAKTLGQLRGLAARLRDPHEPAVAEPGECADPGTRRDQVPLDAPGAPMADPGQELFYILREAMLNALSHSHARRVVVDVKQGPGGITMLVEDDGEGFEPERLPPQQRVGLISMRERTALVGGRLHIDSVRQRGTRVSLHVPYREPSSHAHG